MSIPEIDLPWSSLVLRDERGNLAPLREWFATVTVDGQDHPLSSAEFLRLCAAAELERVHARDLRRLLRSHRRGNELTWAKLVDGALGLRTSDAREGWTLRNVLDRLSVSAIVLEMREDHAHI